MATRLESQAEICARLPDAVLQRRLAASLAGSPQSLRTYREGMARAQRAAGAGAGAGALCALLLRPEETAARLRAHPGWSAGTRLATMSALLALYKHAALHEDARAGGRFARAARRLKELYQEARAERDAEGAAQTRTREVSWADVERVSAELEARALALEREGAGARVRAAADEAALLSSFYVDMEPRRQSDYHRVFVLRDPRDRARAEAEPAHVDATSASLRVSASATPTLHVRAFKTANRYGPWARALPERTWRLLRRSLESRPREYVFARATGEPFESANAFTKKHNALLRGWFGTADVTLRVLRHSRASMLHSDARMTHAEREAAAHAMGHSLKVSGEVYATGARPALRPDGSYDALGTGADGRAVLYECRPKRERVRRGEGT